MSMRLAPPRDEFLKLRVRLLGQHDLQRHILIAMAALRFRDTLALQSQHGAAIGALGDREHYGAGRCRRLDLAAEYRFRERDRQFDADIVIVAREYGMRAHFNLDQRIARLTAIV